MLNLIKVISRMITNVMKFGYNPQVGFRNKSTLESENLFLFFKIRVHSKEQVLNRNIYLTAISQEWFNFYTIVNSKCAYQIYYCVTWLFTIMRKKVILKYKDDPDCSNDPDCSIASSTEGHPKIVKIFQVILLKATRWWQEIWTMYLLFQ